MVFGASAASGAELVAHYTFDDPDDLGHDSSGQENHADTVTNVDAVEGWFGGGAFFDQGRRSAFVKNGGLTGFTGKPGQTFAAWVKLDPGSTGYDGIISLDSGSCCETRILISPSHNAFINLSQHDDRHFTNGPPFEFDEWTHIVMTGEDQGANSEARVYINGVELAQSPQMFPLTESAESWNTYLGAGEGGGTHFLTGTLDEVRVYQGLLTEEEIQALLSPTPPSKWQFQLVSELGPERVLTFTWESAAGKVYNLRSALDPSAADPGEWAIYDGHSDMDATPPTNTLTVPFPADDPARYFVLEEFNAPPVEIYSEDFENGMGGWTTGSDGAAGTSWELGTPSGVGPTAANSGDNCFATNLDANYADEADVWLRSPAIDLTTAGGATVNFYQARDIEPQFDAGRVAILDAADDTELAVVEDSIDGQDITWNLFSRSLPAEALGKLIKIEFRFESDDFQDFPGWYIDDVTVTVP